MTLRERFPSRWPLAIGAAAVTVMLALGGVVQSAGTARAALPRGGASFVGSGADYLNNAPSWRRYTAEPVSFKVSANRSRILDFKGRYFYYCGAGTADVTARYIYIRPSGRFQYRFHLPYRAPNGQVLGTAFIAIEGRFNSETSATLSYLVDYGEGQQRIAAPYSPAHPHALGCASWVRSSAHLHA